MNIWNSAVHWGHFHRVHMGKCVHNYSIRGVSGTFGGVQGLLSGVLLGSLEGPSYTF